MSDSISSDIPASGYDADELGQYRSLSSLAVIAFVLGLASALMFATPLLVVIPLAATAAALLALRGISASEGGLSGSSLAIAGLGLAVLFTVGSYARVQVRESILLGQVDHACQHWLNLASRGSVDEMLELMTPKAAEKLKPSLEVADPGSFFSGMLNSALMRQSTVVSELSSLREQGEPRFRITESQVFTSTTPVQAVIEYAVDAKSDTPTGELSCGMGLRRLRASGGQQVWLIDSWQVD